MNAGPDLDILRRERIHARDTPADLAKVPRDVSAEKASDAGDEDGSAHGAKKRELMRTGTQTVEEY
jgi:hypothetical protein